nr:MAG TPA: hypothetical protein [Caudoviricetes sp.]
MSTPFIIYFFVCRLVHYFYTTILSPFFEQKVSKKYHFL